MGTEDAELRTSWRLWWQQDHTVGLLGPIFSAQDISGHRGAKEEECCKQAERGESVKWSHCRTAERERRFVRNCSRVVPQFNADLKFMAINLK